MQNISSEQMKKASSNIYSNAMQQKEEKIFKMVQLWKERKSKLTIE